MKIKKKLERLGEEIIKLRVTENKRIKELEEENKMLRGHVKLNSYKTLYWYFTENM